MTTEKEETKYNMEEYSHKIAPVINSYYMLMEAADLFERLMERLLNAAGMDVKGNIKYRHKIMMKHLDALRLAMETFFKDYEDAFKGDWDKYDEIQRAANYYCRLILLIADRTYNNESKELEIETMIKNLKSSGRVDQRFIDVFNFR